MGNGKPKVFGTLNAVQKARAQIIGRGFKDRWGVKAFREIPVEASRGLASDVPYREGEQFLAASHQVHDVRLGNWNARQYFETVQLRERQQSKSRDRDVSLQSDVLQDFT